MSVFLNQGHFWSLGQMPFVDVNFFPNTRVAGKQNEKHNNLLTKNPDSGAQET